MKPTHENRRRPAQTQLPRVVIVGGGFGGLYAARALSRAPVAVTIIDKHNYHLFRPMLYQVATGLVSSDEVALCRGGIPPEILCEASGPELSSSLIEHLVSVPVDPVTTEARFTQMRSAPSNS